MGQQRVAGGDIGDVNAERVASEPVAGDDLVDLAVIETAERDGRDPGVLLPHPCQHAPGQAAPDGQYHLDRAEPRVAEHGGKPAQVRAPVRVIHDQHRRTTERDVRQAVS